VYGPVLFLGGGRSARGLVDVSHPIGVRDVSTEAGFKRVAGAVGEEGRHTGGAETGLWWLHVRGSVSYLKVLMGGD